MKFKYLAEAYRDSEYIDDAYRLVWPESTYGKCRELNHITFEFLYNRLFRSRTTCPASQFIGTSDPTVVDRVLQMLSDRCGKDFTAVSAMYSKSLKGS